MSSVEEMIKRMRELEEDEKRIKEEKEIVNKILKGVSKEERRSQFAELARNEVLAEELARKEAAKKAPAAPEEKKAGQNPRDFLKAFKEFQERVKKPVSEPVRDVKKQNDIGKRQEEEKNERYINTEKERSKKSEEFRDKKREEISSRLKEEEKKREEMANEMEKAKKEKEKYKPPHDIKKKETRQEELQRYKLEDEEKDKLRRIKELDETYEDAYKEITQDEELKDLFKDLDDAREYLADSRGFEEKPRIITKIKNDKSKYKRIILRIHPDKHRGSTSMKKEVYDHYFRPLSAALNGTGLKSKYRRIRL